MTVHTQMPEGVAAAPAEERLFLGLPTWIRAGRQNTAGALSLVEQVIPPGFESPWHIHHDEDESFYVIEGSVDVVVEERTVTLAAGGYAFGPRGIAHGFRVTGSGPARLLLMTNSSGLADFIHEASDPAGSDGASASGQPDLGRLLAAAERHGLAILGPMPR